MERFRTAPFGLFNRHFEMISSLIDLSGSRRRCSLCQSCCSTRPPNPGGTEVATPRRPSREQHGAAGAWNRLGDQRLTRRASGCRAGV